MAALPKNLGRQNDIYPIKDIADATNNVGSDLAVGDIVLIDWTADGDNASLISPSSQALVTTHMKAVVLPQPNQNGIPSLGIGNVRVQGPCSINSATGIVFTRGDPIAISLAGSATDNAIITSVTVTAPGSNSTYIPLTVGAVLVTIGSLNAQQLVSCFFDGSEINAIFLKD